MKIWKRFAAALLAAGMVLAMFTACSGGGGGAPLTWETSQTKQYFESRGITPARFTFKAKMAYSGTKSDVVYTVKDNQLYINWSVAGFGEILRDAQGNYYLRDRNSSESRWIKYDAGSEWAKNYGSMVVVETGVFTVPTDDNVGSVVSGSYRMGGKSYSTETIRIHENNNYQTCVYGYDGNELSFILVEMNGSAMLTELDLSNTEDAELLKTPTNFIPGSDGGGHPAETVPGGGSAAGPASSEAASGAGAEA